MIKDKTHDNSESLIEKLKKELEAVTKERDEYQEGWKRERADFLNYKKSEIQRISDNFKCANEDLIVDLIPVLDSFDLAIGTMKKSDNPDIEKGLYLIKNQLENLLVSRGLKEISAKDRKFDVSYDEVIEEVDSHLEPGSIVEVMQKGYMLFDKVIRPNKVKISKLNK